MENWYYRILVLMTGNLKNAEIAVDALSIWYALFLQANGSNSTQIHLCLFHVLAGIQKLSKHKII